MKKVCWGIGTVVTLFITTLLLLCFGNPQLSKYIYYWQGEIYPTYEHGFVPIPHPYTGVWRMWDEELRLSQVSAYKDGKAVGFNITYHENGNRCVESRVTHGPSHTPSGISTWYYDSGKLYQLTLWDGKGGLQRYDITIIYDHERKIDLRDKYAKEIAKFEADLKAFDEENGLK